MNSSKNTDDDQVKLFLGELRRKRAKLEARAAELSAEIKNTTAAIKAIEVLLDGGTRIDSGSDRVSATVLVERKYTKNNNISKKLRELSRRALMEAGQPLSRQHILSFASREGVELPYADPAQFLGKVLWRSKEFIRLPQGYWLANVPLNLQTAVEPDEILAPRDETR